MNWSMLGLRGIIGLLFGLFWWHPTFAYNIPLHQRITDAAVEKVMETNDFLNKLGISPIATFSDGDLVNSGFTAAEWINFGSAAEDDVFNPPTFPFPRSTFHFFDGSTQSGLFQTFESARTWMQDSATNPVYSVPDARDSLYNALTTLDPLVRERHWAAVFRAVGQFTHLIQDMAQPQHVRDDIHFSLGEPYNRVLSNGGGWSRYEQRTTNFVVPGTGYTPPRFPDYESYFKNPNGSGLAEFTNGHFVSEGTNFESGTRYSAPNLTDTFEWQITLPTVSDAFGNVVAVNVPIRYVGNNYNDPITNLPKVNDFLSARSMFDFKRNQYVGRSAFTLNNTNHEEYAKILIPLAVAYSAGVIDHFFRGAMEISLPDQGVYAIVDHSQASAYTKDTGGFTQIKLKVRNTSPSVNNDGVPEAMTNGNLVAVMKFRRNTRYMRDLSGYPESTDCFDSQLGDTCSSQDEEVIVSDVRSISSLDATDTQFTFNFSSPLPINATNVRLQLVFRGTLGSESGAIVVATRDISEPTYFSYMNASDYIHIGDSVYLRSDVDADPMLLNMVQPQSCINPATGHLYDVCLQPFDLSMTFDFWNSTSTPSPGPTITVAALPPKHFFRVAILTDRPDGSFAVQGDGNFCFPHDPYQVDSLDWQDDYDKATEITIVTEPNLKPLRGVFGWVDVSCVINGDGADPNLAEDDRNTKMNVLSPIPDPFPVQLRF